MVIPNTWCLSHWGCSSVRSNQKSKGLEKYSQLSCLKIFYEMLNHFGK